jgi:DMSO/TMAO reductase YedYZ molybdopterin-dependent catalytic subunit
MGLSAAMLWPRWGWGEIDSPMITTDRWRRQMARFPEKTDLILLTDRPPQLETPLKYFQKDLTPNEAFFVRWHEAGIPTRVDTNAFRLEVGGHVDKPLSLSLEDLKKNFEPVSVVAVAQCSGNSRSYFQPRVPGGQWANGAMGNAKWTGVRLRDLLKAAGLKAGAIDVSLQGLDRPPMPDTPVFAKSITAEHANDPDVIVAYAMNDADLPMVNGFPLRLIVPGWYATYWVKSLAHIQVWDKPFDGFWMAKAYRIPADASGNEAPDKLATKTVPINRMTVRALFVVPEKDQDVSLGDTLAIQGVAFDYGAGIARVEISTDGGKTWADAKLEKEIGKYSFRRWRYEWKPTKAGQYAVQCKATNRDGKTQVTEQWNRSGYLRNVIQQVNVTVA